VRNSNWLADAVILFAYCLAAAVAVPALADNWDLPTASVAHEKSVANDKAQERAQAEETWHYVIKSVDYAMQMGDTHCQVNYEVSRFPKIRQNLEAKGYTFKMIGLSLVEVSW
jgi:hypothetical protein